VTRTPLTRSKGQGHQAALLTAALTREASAAVTAKTYWAWETTATLHLLGGARGAGAPTGEEERGGGISRRHAHSLLKSKIVVDLIAILAVNFTSASQSERFCH